MSVGTTILIVVNSPFTRANSWTPYQFSAESTTASAIPVNTPAVVMVSPW